MEHTIKLVLCGLATILLSQNSYAVLDDGFALQRKSFKKTTKTVAKPRIKKSVRTKNDKKMIANSIKQNKKIVIESIRSVKKSLGAVPVHIQENWNSLSNDQKEIVYSYHNENPYAEINKEHFQEISQPKDNYEHDTVYGFDSGQQVSLDDLREDINGATKQELPEDTRVIVEALAAIEDDM
jgi:GTPase Era involved in 16S rRNA processing